ncbi:helix-turn-helix transcriptional regulator [uncultured Marivita sp.]|uniref:helix-turn-helix transcriptional regulator n=1 Tax=uncultured Marivita sp. TaxID=888080 RepID=UPI002634397E|nr:helix-turn-helix transcriptional regulator [uncultured Marivita sp.]
MLWDILGSVLGINSSPIAWVYYELAQIGAVIGLILGVVVSATLLLRSIRKQRAAEESLRLASGAFMDVLHERFAEWELTPAEKDVALFSIKGLSTADIASLRNTSEGTVKAQTNAIYRKAGVSGRPQLLSLFIDELMSDPIGEVAPKAGPEVIEKAS